MTTCNNNMNKPYRGTRRYEIDWLRIIAFVLLIFYHIGMYYVADWGWHVKSEHQSHFLQNIMLIINPWRMPLIFLISGAALALVEHKLASHILLKVRFKRLFLPLVAGMYLIVPPQLYFELVGKEGFTGSYLSFFVMYIDVSTPFYTHYQHSPLGLLTWHHLWYLAYLWLYTLLYAAARRLFCRLSWHVSPAKTCLTGASAFWAFLLLVGMLMVYALALKPHFPQTKALFNDWYSHAVYLTVFTFGYVLAKFDALWRGMIQKRRLWACIAFSHCGLLLMLFHDVFLSYFRSAGYDIQSIEQLFITKITVQWILCSNVIAWLFMVVGYAGAYLNKPHPILNYMNQAILPWYILHQTIIVSAGVGLSSLSLGPVVESLMLVLLTFSICAIAYELIKRNRPIRFIFGMKHI